jgi:hypothetical protein
MNIMASAKKDTTKVEPFDYSAFVPEGMKLSDLTVVEHTLTPIYAAEQAFEEKWPPACGWTDRFVILPEQVKGKGDSARSHIPKMVQIYLEYPTKALKGTGDDKLATDMKKGEAVLIPLNAQQLRNVEMLMAVADEKNSYYMIARVRGTIPVNQPQDMWDWEITINKAAPRKREGKFAIPIGGTRLDLILPEGTTSTGEKYDAATGEALEKKGNTASASA